MNFLAKNFNELTLTELYEILKTRMQVFIVEKNMCCAEIDGVDPYARHFFIEENGKIMAYLRAIYDNGDESTIKIGRVLTVRRGVGLGAEIMRKAILDISENMQCKKICLNSQKQVIGFYEKLGFKAVSDEFLEEGILHVKMELKI